MTVAARFWATTLSPQSELLRFGVNGVILDQTCIIPTVTIETEWGKARSIDNSTMAEKDPILSTTCITMT